MTSSEDMISMELKVKSSPEEEAKSGITHKIETFEMMDPHSVLAYIFRGASRFLLGLRRPTGNLLGK